MSSKFMKIKKIVIPMMTFIILTSQLCGCAMFKPTEMVEAINQGESITIEVAEPSYPISIQGEQVQEVTWIQLDQLKTFNTGFRQGFDKAFNITVVNENGFDGKSGCLYVNANAERDGNTTLEDALRNKTFNTKYWSDTKTKNELIKLASEAYTDIANDSDALIASFNAYYNLLNDAKNPDSFNATQSLTREEFYTLVVKATTPVQDLEVSSDFVSAVGGETEYTKYAAQIADKGFLQVGNKSLDNNNISGTITRAEAVYLIVNSMFPDQLASVTGKEAAFSDTKNAGDLALKSGFKEQVKVEGQKEKQLVEKERWQAYTLAYSLNNPDKGLQEELYKAMVVAKNLNIVGGSESRWDESISKKEAIQLVMSAFFAQNQLNGYASEVEYGSINPNNFGPSSGNQENLTTDEFLIESGTDEQGRPVAGVDEKAIEEEIKKIEQEAGLPDGIPDEVQKLIDELEENPNKYSESDTSTPSIPSTPETPSTPSQPSNNNGNNSGSTSSGGDNIWRPAPGETDPTADWGGEDDGSGQGAIDGDPDLARPELWN